MTVVPIPNLNSLKPNLYSIHSKFKAPMKNPNYSNIIQHIKLKSNTKINNKNPIFAVFTKKIKKQKNPRTQFIHHVNLTSNNKNHD